MQMMILHRLLFYSCSNSLSTVTTPENSKATVSPVKNSSKWPSHSHAIATFTFFLKENAAPASLLRKTDAAEVA